MTRGLSIVPWRSGDDERAEQAVLFVEWPGGEEQVVFGPAFEPLPNAKAHKPSISIGLPSVDGTGCFAYCRWPGNWCSPEPPMPFSRTRQTSPTPPSIDELPIPLGSRISRLAEAPAERVPIGEGSYPASAPVEGANAWNEEPARDSWARRQPV